MSGTTAVILIFAWLASLALSYLIIRLAVRDGMRDAMRSKEEPKQAGSWMDRYR